MSDTVYERVLGFLLIGMTVAMLIGATALLVWALRS